MEKEESSEKPKTDLNKKEVREELHGEHNSRGRGRSPAERKKDYKRYNEVKKKIVELEASNVDSLYLFPASDHKTNKKKFYILGGASAIIYAHEIGPRIGKHPVLRRDMDNGTEKLHSGICSVQDLKGLEEKLSKIGIKQIAPPEGYEELIVFRLNRRYEQKELKNMLKAEQEDIEKLNKVLYANVLYPDVHKLVLDLKRVVPRKVKNMDKTYREVVGMKMIDTLEDIIEAYSQMTHGDIDELSGAETMLKGLSKMYAQTSLMNELEVWDVSSCARVGDIIAGIRKTLKGNIVNKYEANK